MNIVAQLGCLATVLDKTTIRQLGRLSQALLTMSGRVTMLGISRWGGRGSSYRSVQRFFHKALPWGQMNWQLFKQRMWRPDEEYLLVGDESVITKAGKQTHGVGRFYATLAGKVVPGLAFLALGLVGVEEGRAYPLLLEQRLKNKPSSPPPPTTEQEAAPRIRRCGRPKGSRNRDKQQIEWNDELRLLAQLLEQFWQLAGNFLKVRYLLLDGHFGTNNALLVARQHKLHLVSKLRHDAALYLPYEGEYAGRGPRRKYGERLNLQALPAALLKERRVEEHYQSDIYQATVWHKSFALPLNVVILVRTNLRTQQRGVVILFSSDLELSYERLIRFYQLRFQIEFVFRDAKQFWGLEDFMTVRPVAVRNAAALALWMVNLSHLLLHHQEAPAPAASVLDLKAYFRGRFYAAQTLNALPSPPDPFIFERILDRIAALTRIHSAAQPALAA